MISQEKVKKWILAIEKSQEIRGERGSQKYYEASVLHRVLSVVLEDSGGRLPWWLAEKVGEE